MKIFWPIMNKEFTRPDSNDSEIILEACRPVMDSILDSIFPC